MRCRLALVVTASLASPAAFAGVYLAPAVRWAQFAVRPEASEPTPNYTALGGAVALGYSFGQIVDFGLAGSFLPGHRGGVGKNDASLVSYGGELALRLVDSVYLGMRGGPSTYSLHHQKDDTDLVGTWRGGYGAVMLGAVSRVGKEAFLGLSFDVEQHVLAHAAAASAEDGASPRTTRRRFDCFAVSFTYTYNAQSGYLIDNTVFKDFLDSIIF